MIFPLFGLVLWSQSKLRMLCELAASTLPGHRVLVLEAWSPPANVTAGTTLPAPTLPNSGRGLRVAIVSVSAPTTVVVSLLGRLGGLAVAAGFDWVTHAVFPDSAASCIRASVRPDECQTDLDLLFVIDGSGSM